MGLFQRLLGLRVPANLLFVTILLGGLFALVNMPVEEYPNVAFDQIEIVTVFPGASAVEVERLVTRVIEDEIEDVRGIEWLRSTSGQDLSRILVKLEEDLPKARFDAAYRDLESEARRALPDLPEGAEEPVVTKIEVESLNPVVQVILGGDVREDVLRAATDELERRLETLPGVRGVNVFGRRDREIHVDLDPERLAAADLTLAEVADALALRNVNVPSGQLEGGGASLSVRSVGEWTSPADVPFTAVRGQAQGGVVLLGEVGAVREDYEEALIRGRFHGEPCAVLAVIKGPEANALSIRDAVEQTLDRFRGELPQGMELTTVADTTIRIRSRIATLVQNIGLGALLVVVLLTLTIGFRMSLLALWGVAFSFLGAFCVLSFFDQSLNTLSLFGLVLVSGMLVDDTIVILENIVRHFDEGEDLLTACAKGAREVAWPVVASVATTMAAFMPLLMMSGLTGKFFAVIPIAVCAALSMSLFEAVFILPVHAYELGVGKRRAHREADAWADRPGLMRRSVTAVVAWTTQHRYLALVLLLVLGGGVVGGASRLRVVFFPSDFQQFFINLKLPPGASIDQTTALIDRIDADLGTMDDGWIDSALGTAGFYYDFNYQPHTAPHYGQLLVTVPEADRRARPVTEIMDEVRRRIAALDLGTASIEVTELNDGPPVGRPVALRMQCDDLGRLEAMARAVEAVARETPGVLDVMSGVESGKQEVYCEIEPAVAALRGVSAAAIGRTLLAANDGLVATRYKGLREDWDVRVRLRPEARTSLRDLAAAEVRTRSGARIPIGDVSEIGERPTHASIERFQRERVVMVTGDVDTKVTSSLDANRSIERALRPLLADNPDVTLTLAGEFEETQKSFDSLGQAFVIAVLVMYMILGAQFGSYVQPFVVLGAVPFALVGVVAGLHIVGDPMTVPVLLGVVGLAGVAVNDAIVLISFANDRVDQGMTPLAAVREAAVVRVRPIMLTTLTTIVGLLPSAIGIGSGGRSVIWGPMASAFAFGLASATVLTIIATPALYLIARDLVGLVRKRGEDSARTESSP